ncbi:myb-like protein Q [Belonocnema kinseyi]|uniref:myb-like protein Q n=1 Tax=Belonocnema kinseyi TaxID=2817044 RepID=UPI00143D43C4|nr:myb-like protein Q [Belonocnema kinseyi]
MRLEVFLVFFLAPLCLAKNDTTAQRSPRTPQGHVQYSEPDGYKISWKLFSPYTQWKSYLENPEPQEKTEQVETVSQPKTATPQELAPVEKQQPQQEQQQLQQQQPQIEQPVDYQPYAMVPPHIKQLIFKMYEPQGPYVDPSVYIYHTPYVSKSEDQNKSTQSQSVSDKPEQKAGKSEETVSQETEKDKQAAQQKVDDYHQATHQEDTSHQAPLQQRTTPLYHQQQFQEDAPMYHQPNSQLVYDKYPVKEGDVEYRKETSESKPAQEESVPQQTSPQSEVSAKTTQYALHTEENNMPSLLQQLLHLQAQIPYYVIANRIASKPINMFIPKPIYEDENGSYAYRSQVYYLLNDPVEQEDKSAKRAKQDQRP